MSRYEQAMREVQAEREAEAFERGASHVRKKFFEAIDKEFLALQRLPQSSVGMGEQVLLNLAHALGRSREQIPDLSVVSFRKSA